MMFTEVKMQQDTWCLCNYVMLMQVKLQKTAERTYLKKQTNNKQVLPKHI